MPFALYEYDAAFTAVFDETVGILARGRSPMLSQIRFAKTSGPLGSRVRTRDGMDVELEPGETTAEITTDLRAVRAGDYTALYCDFDKASEDMAKGLVGLLVQSMSAVTEATGNVTDVGGRPLSFEVIYEMLEKMEFSLDENDELVLPAIFVNPDTAKKFESLPPATPQQEEKMDALKERKRQEALARRRRRRLS